MLKTKSNYVNIKLLKPVNISLKQILGGSFMQKVAIFGSTGSIGTTTLRIIEENPELFSAVTLVAGRNVDRLIEQIKKFVPVHVYITSEENAKIIKTQFPNLDVYCGPEGLQQISKLEDADIAVSALVGIAGLEPTYHMIKNTPKVALANKEVLVTGGELIMNLALDCGTQLLTVDSEHSAIMQCLNGERSNPIDKILLTASGGPFFDKEITDDITPEQALNHPTWSMGPKVTIDSSTMMNKGFEVIEARWLFDVSPENIEVVVHRQSLVHSMVQFKDGTIMANIGPKDMQIPIAYALNYPNRLKNSIQKLDLFKIKTLCFEKPDLNKFRCLKLAFESINAGHSAQVVLNAANEVAVNNFLNKKIRYTDIPICIEKALESHSTEILSSIEDILALDIDIRKSIAM